MGFAWEYLERLTRFPHRGTATPEERAAAEEIGRTLSSLGYEIETQEFATPKDTLYLGPSVVLVGFAAALAVGHWLPWVGVLVCLVLLAPMVGELLGSNRLDFDRILPRYRSQNVIAQSVSPGQGSGRRTVVISAHYDTQRASLLFHPALARFIQPYFTVVYVLIALAPVLLALRWALPAAGWVWPAMMALAGLLLANVVFLLYCRVTGRYINGANDNGSGAALALALAHRFSQSPLKDTDLVFVLTGAEEVGTRGMKAFLRTHSFDAGSTWFVNLDNIGGGKLHYLKGEGMVSVKPYGPAMLSLAGAMAAEHGGRVQPKGNLLLPTDGLVPAKAGYQAISFLAFQEDGSLPNYHWYTDTLDQIDRELLEFAETFLGEYVERLAGRRTAVEV